MQKVLILAIFSVFSTLLPGSTLRQLSLDDMIKQSTLIVRGKVQPNSAAFHGSIIFSHYQLQITETLKGKASGTIDIVVPGGASRGLQQTYAGAPSLSSSQDYVMFLWTSKSGLTQVIGLSQGLFAVVSSSTNQPIVIRAASIERMLDASGQPVTDSDIQMSLSALRTRIQSVLAGGGK